jgi:hypothetical protein
MTFHPNDPTPITRERQRRVRYINYTPWIIGTASVGLLMFLMVFFMSGNHHNTAASNMPRALVPQTTTGSAVPSAPGAR